MSISVKKSRSMEFHIDSESLIFAVRDRPYLFDYALPDYSNKAKKLAGWLEICEEILPNWNELNKDEKECCELELQKKWRNMRDSFTKEYKKQTIAEIEGRPPPRAYLYYQALSFLEPVVKRRHSKIVENIIQHTRRSNSNSNSNSRTNIECKTEVKEDWGTEPEYLNDEANEPDENLPTFHEVLLENMAIEDDSSNDTAVRPAEKQKTLKRKLHTPGKTTNYPNPHKKSKLTDSLCDLTLAMKNQFNNEFKDPDEMFLLSLVPYFKRFNQNQKLQAQIQILTMMKQRIDDIEYE